MVKRSRVEPGHTATRAEEGPGSLARRLAAGAAIKFIGEALARLASFGIVLWAARALGPADFGAYLFGLGAGFVLAQGADLGLQLLISREVATQGHGAAALIRLALRGKLILAGLLVLALVPLTGGRPPSVQIALIALGAAMLVQTFTEFAAYVFRGHQQLEREVGLLTATRLSLAAVSGLVLLLNGGLLPLSLAVLGANVLSCGIAVSMLRRAGWLDTGQTPATHAGTGVPARIGALVREALPLGLALVFSAVYLRVGWILLSYLVGDEAVAELGVAQRLVEAAQLVPAAVIAAVFPAYTRALRSGGTGPLRLAPASATVLAALGALATGTLWWAADWMVPVLFGPAYVRAIPILRIFALAVPLMFLNYLFTHMVIARGQQRLIAWFGAATLTLHVGLCWLLIPRSGTVAVAASTLAAECLLFLCCVAALRARPRHEPGPAGPSPDPADTARSGLTVAAGVGGRIA